jgi:hypothetical protein
MAFATLSTSTSVVEFALAARMPTLVAAASADCTPGTSTAPPPPATVLT